MTVNINIHYVGNLSKNNNDTSWSPTKIVLFLDDEFIYGGQLNSHILYLLSLFFISADKPYLKVGQHNISLKACVAQNGQILNIFFVDIYNIEYTIEPKNLRKL